MKLAFVRACVTTACAAAVLSGAAPRSALSQPDSDVPIRLAADSPLAAELRDGKPVRVFAVAEDHRTIVARPSDLSAPWTVLWRGGAELQISGLASKDDSLFLADSASAAVYRLSLPEGTHELLHRGSPLVHPTALAVDEVLFVADTDAGAILRITLETSARDMGSVEGVGGLGESVALGVSDGTLIVSVRERGQILRILHAARPAEAEAKVLQAPVDGPARETLSERGTEPRSVYVRGKDTTSEYPTVARPGAVTAYRGIVYVVDGDGRVVSTPRRQARPIPSHVTAPPVGRAESILATATDLFVLDRETREVVRWPRPVPTEFIFEGDRPSECMASFYAYLEKRAMLQPREVSFDETFEKTLRNEGALRSRWVAGLNAPICHLNSSLCRDEIPKPIEPNARVQIPALFVESTLKMDSVDLRPGESLLARAEREITSAELAWAAEAQSLCKLNPGLAPDVAACERLVSRPLQGRCIVPKEVVRYVAAVPESDVREGVLSADIEQVVKTCGAESTYVNPLERRLATSAHTPVPADWAVLDAAYEQILSNVVAYDKSLVPRTAGPVYVGVVEKTIDYRHEDFSDGARHAFLDTDPTPAPSHAFAQRPWSDGDHGTSVAWLIAGQRRRGSNSTAGLAPFATLVSFRMELNELNAAIVNSPKWLELSVINLSLKAPTDNESGLKQIARQNRHVLFVAVAGNGGRDDTTREVCEEFLVFPACLDEEENVLVVTATDAHGEALLPSSEAEEGANWSPKHVHLAAPGAGFVAAGFDQAYVPVRGTSFAAPLVSATAAALVAQGVGRGGPAQIKRRLIATSDYATTLTGQKVVAGRLNYKRAVYAPKVTVVKTRSGEERRIDVIDNPALLLRFANDREHTRDLRDVLRLQSEGDHYWMIYMDEETNIGVATEVRKPAGANWSFKYRDSPSGVCGAPIKTASLDEFEDYVASVR